VRPEHSNFHGSAHGGFIFSLADTVFAVASNSHGPRAVAIAASLHFSRPAGPGETLVAEARESSLGRRTATYEVTIAREDEVIATFIGTVYRRP
jgi:acyl-CoA thioesterase